MNTDVKRILIPLNGSKQAELAVTAAMHLAKKMQAACILFHAIEAHAKSEIHGHTHLLDCNQAKTYLSGIAAQMSEQGVTVEVDIHELPQERIPASIAEHVNELNIDLVVIALHEGGGLHEMLHGSAVQQLIALSDAPVLMLKSNHAEMMPLFRGRILVALDGSPSHEAGIEWAVRFAQTCQLGVHLLQVVPTSHDLTGNRAATRNLLPNATEAALEAATQSAAEYLRGLCLEYKQQDVDIRGEVRRGDVVEQISHSANEKDTGLLVLATHGRSAWDAFWSRSKSPQLIAITACAALLVRVHGEEDDR